MNGEPSAPSPRHTGMRKLPGIALLTAAVVVFASGYAGKADAQTCASINGVYQSLGEPATCSSGPGTAVIVWAAVLAVAGIAALVLARRAG